MTDLQFARSILTKMIEKHALDHGVSFIDAAREITNRNENYYLVGTAYGKWWKPGPLSYSKLIGLRDRTKHEMTKHLDKLTHEELLKIQPYLPVKKRMVKTD